jgi:hypothetical protein
VGVRGLSCYISGLSALLAVMFSAVTWAPPGPGPVERSLPVVFTLTAAVAAVIALVLGQMPPLHPIRQSRSLHTVFVLVAVSVTVLAVIIG